MREKMIEIKYLVSTDDVYHTVDAVNKLLNQLVSNQRVIGRKGLVEIVRQPNARLYIAYEKNNVVGMLFAAVYRSPSRFSMVIEDVVVAEMFRRRKVGNKLLEAAILWAQQLGVETIDLTSRPERIAANKLYRSLGFEPRDTTCYRVNVRK